MAIALELWGAEVKWRRVGVEVSAPAPVARSPHSKAQEEIMIIIF